MRTQLMTPSEYLGSYVQELVVHAPVPKVGMAAIVALVAQVEQAFVPALLYVLVLWFVDFGLGVAKAIADPETQLTVLRARHGLVRLGAIPLIVLAAAIAEGLIVEVSRVFGEEAALQLGGHLGGRFILAACVAMAWEELVSIQGHATFFYRRVRIRFAGRPPGPRPGGGAG